METRGFGFTKWLQDNTDVLNDILGLSLSSPEREKSAGTFSVDLVAENGDRISGKNKLISSIL
jgi:hypothetical protein